MRRVVMGIAAAVLSLAVAAGSGDRATAGGCTSSGGPSNIQQRIDAARSGAVVCMEAGVYRGPIIVYGKSGITLRGAGQQATIVAGGTRDGVVVLNSSDVTVEHMKLFLGTPANAYVGNSGNVLFRSMDFGAGNIGVHYDDRSSGTVADSFIYAMRGDGALVRRGSALRLERNWIFDNLGVGVSTVGVDGTTTVVRNIISHNRGAGVFAGVPPCAPLYPASIDVPPCFLSNLHGYISGASLTLDTNIVQQSGSTGIVAFPGVRVTMRGNRVWANHLSGLFAWGANVTSDGDEYASNDENAIELRAYPEPVRYAGGGFPLRTVARLNGNDIHDSLALPQTGTLGGGVVAHGADFHITNSRVWRNRSIAVAWLNGAFGHAENNDIYDNGGSGLCMLGAGPVSTVNNRLWRNASDIVGVCR
jgi:hypothetical protein